MSTNIAASGSGLIAPRFRISSKSPPANLPGRRPSARSSSPKALKPARFTPGRCSASNLGGPSEDELPPYIPLDRQRAGFYVSGENIAIDLDNPRFASAGSEGEALFDDGGEPGPALRQIQRMLGQLVRGKQETDAFIARLLDLRLIEPLDVSLRFDDGEDLVLDGLYTVSLDILRDLADGDVLKLFRDGHLQWIYLMAGSLKQIGVLAERRNRKLAGRS